MREITAVVIGAPGCCDRYSKGNNGVVDILLNEDGKTIDIFWKDGTITREYYIVTIHFGHQKIFAPRPD